MTKRSFEIIIPCGQNSDKYVARYIKSALETASNEIELTFSIGINNFPEFNESLLHFVPDHARLKITEIPTDTAPGSIGHAQVLHELYDRVTEPYTIVADCDIMMLRKNWDQIMMQRLTDDVEVVGTDYYPFSNLPKYVGFPALVVAAFRTELLREEDISFMPHPFKGAHLINSIEEEVAYGRPRGSLVYLDVGYQFPLKLRPKGKKGYCFPFTKPAVLGCGQEFHYEGAPFLTHMKGSSVRSIDDPDAKFWLHQSEMWNTMTGQKNRVIAI